MKTINVNSTSGYLQMEDLPENCIFNKVVPGCGGTTIALFNNVDYLIAVPTTELIINKTNRLDTGVSEITFENKKMNVFGLFGSFTPQIKKDLKQYIENSKVIKIICTYDKVDALCKLIDVSNYKILVDEYHNLLKLYSYRDTAVNSVLNNFTKFKSYCFMSATPIDAEFVPEALKDAEYIKAIWEHTKKIQVKLIETNKPYNKVVNIINSYKKDGFIEINNKISNEAFFFLNSVKDIATILNSSNLTDDEVKIVCADTPKNRLKLSGYTISNSKSPNKMFTFITSKSFEGADYFSENGMVFVVSNTKLANTLLDISTDIFQISGRIRTRTNPFRYLLVHIFNTSGETKLNIDLTYDGMKQMIEMETSIALDYVDRGNKSSKIEQIALQKIANPKYITYKDDVFTFNDMLPKLELYNYKLNQIIYNSGLTLADEYNENNTITYSSYENIKDKPIISKKSTSKMSFKEAYLIYSDVRKGNRFEFSNVEHIQPLVKDAYEILGDDEVRRLKYIKKDIKDAIISNDNKMDNTIKIAKLLYNKVSTGFTSCKQLKAILTNVYAQLGIDKKAKATDITTYFDTQLIQKKIDGKTVKGYIIAKQSIIFQ